MIKISISICFNLRKWQKFKQKKISKKKSIFKLHRRLDNIVLWIEAKYHKDQIKIEGAYRMKEKLTDRWWKDDGWTNDGMIVLHNQSFLYNMG